MSLQLRSIRASLALTMVAVVFAQSFSLAADNPEKASWPQWRGPGRDGISKEKGLLKTWGEKGPALLWNTKGLGNGYSSVVIQNGSIVTMGKDRGKLILVALSVKDGKEQWKTTLLERAGNDPNCTPTIAKGMVFAMSTEGDLFCVELKSGNILWHKNFPKDFGGKMMSGWGYSESPLIDGDVVICSPGAEDAGIAALDVKTGETIWKARIPKFGDRGGDGAGYSSIVISEGAGVRQYVQLMGRGVISVATKDGRFLWGYNRVANGTANIPTPLINGDYVFCSTGYGTGSALLKLVKDGTDGVKAQEEYFLDAKTMQNHHGGMVMIGDYVYCGNQHNQGFPLCLAWKTGKVVWNPGRGPGGGSAAVVYADGNLYFRYQSGTVALIEATPVEYRLKSTFDPEHSKEPCWAHPVVAGGRLYLRDQDGLFVYSLTSNEVAAR